MAAEHRYKLGTVMYLQTVMLFVQMSLRKSSTLLLLLAL